MRSSQRSSKMSAAHSNFDFLDVLEAGLLNDTTSKLGNFLTHGYNSLACLVDIFISDRPWKSLHFFWPVLMGFTYAAFTLIYWSAGGLGLCFDEPNDGATVQG